LNAIIYQHKPLVVSPPEPVVDTSIAAPVPDFNFGSLDIEDVFLDYGNETSALFARLDLDKLIVRAEELNLPNQTVSLDLLQLNNTTSAIRLGKANDAKVVAARAEDISTEITENQLNAKGKNKIETENGWRIVIKKIELNNNNFSFS